jgi:hypothetical protein
VLIASHVPYRTDCRIVFSSRIAQCIPCCGRDHVICPEKADIDLSPAIVIVPACHDLLNTDGVRGISGVQVCQREINRTLVRLHPGLIDGISSQRPGLSSDRIVNFELSVRDPDSGKPLEQVDVVSVGTPMCVKAARFA